MGNDYEAMIQQRIAQYKWAAEIVKEMIKELGEEKAVEISQRAVIRVQENLAREIAAKYGQTFEGFKHWQHDAAAKNPYHTFSEEGENFIKLKIIGCPSWDALDRLGVPQLGLCYCNSDPAFTRAFSPNLRFEIEHRTSKGDDYCDHTRSWKE